MFNTTVKRVAGPDPLPSDTKREKMMLTALTKVKMPPASKDDEMIVSAAAAARCKTRKELLDAPSQTSSLGTSRSMGNSTARSSAVLTSRSSKSCRSSVSARSDVSNMNSLQREKNQLEDQLWDVAHKADWLKAQTGLRTTMLSKGASPDRWLSNGAKMFMANRYRTTTMNDFVGYHGHDVFSEQVTDTSNRRIRGQAAKYGSRLSSAKITLRGAF